MALCPGRGVPLWPPIDVQTPSVHRPIRYMGPTRLSISVYLESPLDLIVLCRPFIGRIVCTHQIDIPGPQERPFFPRRLVSIKQTLMVRDLDVCFQADFALSISLAGFLGPRRITTMFGSSLLWQLWQASSWRPCASFNANGKKLPDAQPSILVTVSPRVVSQYLIIAHVEASLAHAGSSAWGSSSSTRCPTWGSEYASAPSCARDRHR